MMLHDYHILLVGIGFQARQGKTSLARFLQSELPLVSKCYAFADALKATCRISHGMNIKDAPLLQKVGAAYREEFGKDIWIKALENQLLEERPRIAFIGDMRYKNEFNWVKRNGGITICVKRLTPSGECFQASDRNLTHPSEVDLSHADFDYELQAYDGMLYKLFLDAYQSKLVYKLHEEIQQMPETEFEYAVGMARTSRIKDLR